MSGHSKWATIKRAKGAADAKRSQVFTKLAMAVAVAARAGADPTMNFKLRLAIDRAREANMPKNNIDRAIKRGSGAEGGEQLEEIAYEGYGPGGVAFMIETVTNNKNRTSSNLRHILDKFGGRLAESGSVSWQFAHKSLLITPLPKDKDALELLLIEAGAEDIQEVEEQLIITAEPNALEQLKETLKKSNAEIAYSNVELVSSNKVNVDEATRAKLVELREALEADDDVTGIYDNEA